MYNTLQQLSKISVGLNCLVPQEWWQEFYSLNKNLDPEAYIYPKLQYAHRIDTFLYEYRQDILNQIQDKCNYLKFKRIVLSPQPKNCIKWKPIPIHLFKIIQKGTLAENIYTYIDDVNDIYLFPVKQLQIVFCSRTSSEVFIGFLPSETLLIPLLREIGFELGFIEMQNSKIIFPDNYSEKTYYYQELQNTKLNNAVDTFVMAFNLENHIEQQILPRKYTSLNQPNQAIAGDQATMIEQNMERRINGTLSTGAQTPFSFFDEQGYDLDRQYRMNELFRDKTPEQVQAMKIYANEAIQGELIDIRFEKTSVMEQELQKMAEEIIQNLHAHKKKQKQKQINNTNYE